MKICPKCRESIGETLQVCPLCNYQFTKEDNIRFFKEKEELEYGEAKYLEDLRAKRAKMRVIYSLVMMGLYILPMIIGGTISIFTENVNFYVVFAVIGLVSGFAVMITGIVNGAFRCPFCDRILFRNYGKHCTHCGKQLYY